MSHIVYGSPRGGSNPPRIYDLDYLRRQQEKKEKAALPEPLTDGAIWNALSAQYNAKHGDGAALKALRAHSKMTTGRMVNKIEADIEFLQKALRTNPAPNFKNPKP